MKKILVLSLVLMLVLAACGKSGDGVVSESTAAPEQSATDTSAPADTAPAAKPPTDLHSVVNAASAFGNFRDMMFVYSDDEYADDLLIFTFGMTEEMIGMFDSYEMCIRDRGGVSDLLRHRIFCLRRSDSRVRQAAL